MLIIALKDLYERKIAARRAYWRVRQELETSTDRELRELGISRYDIGDFADYAAREAEAAVQARVAARGKAAATAPSEKRPAGQAPLGTLPVNHIYY